MRESHHPLFRRLCWNPLLVAPLFADVAYQTYASGAGILKLAALGVLGTWLGMSVFDWFTSHDLLDLIYGLDFKDEKLEDAVTAFRAALARQPDDASAHYNLGLALALSDQGNLHEAIGEFREAIRLKPDDAEAQYNLGVALGIQGKLDEAIVAYRQAIRLQPDYTEAHFNLGSALLDQGKLDEAIAELRKARDIAKPGSELAQSIERALAECSGPGQSTKPSEHAKTPSAVAGLAPDSREWHMRIVDQWPDALIVEANNSGLHLAPDDIADLPTFEDLFALVRLEVACPNPNSCSVVVQYKDPTEGPRGGFKPRGELSEQLAIGRSCITSEPAQPGHHPVVVVTVGRNLLFYPSDKHQPGKTAHPSLSPRGAPWNIAVIAYTWGFARAYAAVGYQPQQLQQYMSNSRKTTHDLVKDLIPFFDLLLDLAHSGHNVWVFEGNQGVLEEGCRDADVLIVDHTVISYLSEGWIDIASQVMRGDVVERVDSPFWLFNRETGFLDRVYNLTPGSPIE